MCYTKKMNAKDKKTTFTPLIVAFLDIYIKNGRVNAAQAMREAGFKEKKKNSAANYACEILARNDVKKYIKKREKQISAANKITPEWVVAMAKAGAEKALRGYPVYDKDGNVLYYRPDFNGMNGSLNIIAKVTGLDKTKVEHELKGGGVGLVMHFEGKQEDERED